MIPYNGAPLPLPPGWTQHVAPSGQVYYFNASTGHSTHAHPSTLPPPQMAHLGPYATSSEVKPRKEKPKQKDPLPGAPGWLRVTTNLGNVFYTHPQSKRSEWTVPDEIKEAVRELEAAEASRSSQEETPLALEAKGGDEAQKPARPSDNVGANVRDEEPVEQGFSIETEREELDNSAHSSDGEAAGIDAAELLGSTAITSELNEVGEENDEEGDDDEESGDQEHPQAPPLKRQKIVDSTNQIQGSRSGEQDGEEAWQRELAAQMAAEADEEEGRGENGSPKSRPSNPALPPSAPPHPPLPTAPATFQPPLRPPPGWYSGPPPGFSPPSQPPGRAQLSVEEGKALFTRMLSTLNGTPDEINAMAPWDRELPKFVHLPDYTALVNLRDRQDAFNDWCKNRVREKREQKKLALGGGTSASPTVSNTQTSAASSSSSAQKTSTSPAEAYKKLLADHVKSTRARFEDFKKEFKKDRRFYAFGRDDRDREKHFRNHLKELGEEKRKLAEIAEHNFVLLLEEVVGGSKINQWMSLGEQQLKDEVWSRVKKMGGMESRKEYEAVGSSTRRADLFVRWAKADTSSSASLRREVSKKDEASPSRSGDEADKTSITQDRRAKALREREEQVRQQRQELDRRNRRALGEATRGDSSIHFVELLVDTVRDPLSTWSRASEELAGDARFEAPGLGVHQKRQMFEEHVEKLISRKRGQLRDILLKYAPTLDADGDIVLPLVKDDAEYERLKMGEFVSGVRRTREDEGLQEEWRFWKRDRETKARTEFDEMLKENSFVDFWGRLRSESERRSAGHGRDVEASANKALDQFANGLSGDNFVASGIDGAGNGGRAAGRNDEDDSTVPSLVEMASQVDLEEIHSILRNDQRYRAWKHDPEARDRWIREYLSTLSGRRQTVFQT